MDPAAEQEAQFLANRDKSAALSHIEQPKSHSEQVDEGWFRTVPPEGVAIFARHGEVASKVALYGRTPDFLDKDNILKDHPAKYLLHGPAPADADFPPPALLPIPGSFDAVVQANSRVTPPDHWQDVRLIELHVFLPPSLEHLNICAGNIVTIYPKNFPQDVQWLISRMGWAKIADLPVDFSPYELRRPGIYKPPSLSHPLCPRNLFPLHGGTLRDILLHNLDFTAIPSRTFIEKISAYATNPRQKERLIDLTRLENTQEFYDFASRPRRTILELLADFDSVSLPFEVVLDIFPIIRGRDFSIANGGIHFRSRHKDVVTVEILAALVEYKTIIRKPRQGLCSRYLKHLPEKTPIRVSLNRGSPPANDRRTAERPLIAIATGTGIAPIRSLLYDRDEHEGRGPALLFFGCRERRADFYFQDEWDAMDGLKVLPVFSRDPVSPAKSSIDSYSAYSSILPAQDSSSVQLPPHNAASTGVLSYDYDRGKNYVQHLLRKHAKEVCELFKKGATICICGGSGRMSRSVRQALVDVAVLGGMYKTRDEAMMSLFDDRSPQRLVIWEETW